MEIDSETRKDLKKHISKTGTTTVGIVCKEGIILAADKRATLGGSGGVAYISRKIDKIIPVTNDIAVTTAGQVSDAQKVVKLTRAELKLKELRTKKKPTIKEAANLFSSIVYQNIRQFSPIISITHFLLAGHDKEGSYLYEIGADGTLDHIKDYTSTGSGMLQADPILDAEYKKGLTIDEGVELAKKCINASRKRDVGSGEGMDIYVITKDEVKSVLNQELVSEYKDIE